MNKLKQHNFLLTQTDIKNLDELKALTNLDRTKVIRKALNHLLNFELDRV